MELTPQNRFALTSVCSGAFLFAKKQKGDAKVEKVKETEQTIEIFENDIDMFLKLFCEEQGIEDMRTAPQAVWNAAMMYIKRHVFNVRDILKQSKPLSGYTNNNYNNKYSNLNNSNCNSYNIDLVDSVCNYYIYICNLYNKGVTISGFSKLTGVSEETIYEWGRNENKLSTSGLKIYQKLNAEYEQSAEAKLWGNKNPVAVMAILNKRFGWNLPGVSKEQSGNRALSASELPKLSEKNILIEQRNDE